LTVKKNEETKIDDFLKKNQKKYSIPKIALKALKDFGIFDARVLSVLTETEIASIPNVSEKTALALVRAADDTFRGPLFQKAADQSERLLKKRKYFTTGSDSFNELLGGGMPTSTIIEINGEYRTGKTQTCLTCCVTAQLPEDEGGLGRPVIYIDTENSFQAEHLQDIGLRFGFTSEELLSNLFVVKAEQLRYLNQAIDRLPGYVQALDPGLIIIDSLMAPFRTEFHELNLLAVRQKKLGKLIGLLKRIAIAFNTTVIFTNQVMANIGFGSQYTPVKATGGHVVAHASDIRIFMKKLKQNKRRARIDDCAWLPANKAEFYITTAGIADEDEIDLEAIKEEFNGEKKDATKQKKSTKIKKEEKKEEEEALSEKNKKETTKEKKLRPLNEGIEEVKVFTKKAEEVKKKKSSKDKTKDKAKSQKASIDPDLEANMDALEQLDSSSTKKKSSKKQSANKETTTKKERTSSSKSKKPVTATKKRAKNTADETGKKSKIPA
jgi:RecA/RadA recombinase